MTTTPVTSPPVTAAPLLRAEGLHIAFPGRHGAARARAVDGVDLDIRPGEIVALVGGRAAARRRWPAPCSVWCRRPTAASPSTGRRSTTPHAP